ncbi:hypothetical protein HPP92_003189 [Vanilla planifolia]|uniref:Uncharacterized protein n=1 Tax=Vanilla planifolia TaxID=51239 RepID=A0A835S6Y6_VANPL|nr:hypothetical protein HPP92_003189 [Vanilla planifolia]
MQESAAGFLSSREMERKSLGKMKPAVVMELRHPSGESKVAGELSQCREAVKMRE